MRSVKLPKDNLGAFVQCLKKYGKVYGPVQRDVPYEFKEITDPKDLILNYNRTMIPPKTFFVKLNEQLFEFDEVEGKYLDTVEVEKIVLLGVHSCDIYALRLMDRIYMDENPDLYYTARRNNAIIVGCNCRPDEYCFCESVGTNFATEGFDLFLHELKDGYFIRVGSETGNTIINENKALVSEVKPSDIAEFKESENRRDMEYKLHLNFHGLTEMLAQSNDSDVWKEYADRCFGCGNCNLVCPTCRCYDVGEELNDDDKSGARTRRLDSCMLKKHGLVAGGLNFRPTRVERLRNRFNCKGSLREGMFNCVGCGRCTVYCPSKIDYVEVNKKVRGEL